MNSGNSKTSESYKLLPNLTDKTKLMKNTFLYQILVCTIHGKIFDIHTKIVNLKYQANVSDVNFELTDGSYFI